MELKDFRLASLSTIKAAAALPDHDNNPKQHNRAPDGVDARELTRRLESKLDAFLRCALESEEWKSIENPEAHPSYVRSVMKYVLLEVFLRHPRQVLSRSMIAERLWNEEAENLSNVIDVYVGYLRRKLCEGGEPNVIQTVRGFGYQLKESQP